MVFGNSNLVGLVQANLIVEGARPNKTGNTKSAPIQFQNKGVFDLGDSIFFSYNFENAKGSLIN
jgi:hypothetical protein